MDDAEDYNALLNSVVTATIAVAPRQQLHWHKASTGAYLLLRGWMACMVIVPSGRQQITKLYVPGDLIRVSHAVVATGYEALLALTEVQVGVIPTAILNQTIMAHPSLGLELLARAKRDEILLMSHLTSLGQTEAIERLARLILSLQALVGIDPATDDGTAFEVPLTQARIAELTGMTAVHVNRRLRQLREDGIVRWSGKTIHILDQRQLEYLGGGRAITRSQF